MPLLAVPIASNTQAYEDDMTQQKAAAHPAGIPAGTPVELWYTRCGAATASALAIQKQWLQAEFAQPGTVLHSLRASDNIDVRNSHYNHSVSGMFREGGNIPPIWTKAAGQDTVVVGITWLDEYQGILVRADSDIHAVEDLKGKRLALPQHDNLIDFQRGAALHGFLTALNLAGAGLDAATLVDVKAPFRNEPRDGEPRDASGIGFEAEALLAGKVDAIFLRFARGVRVARDPRFRQILNINELSDPLLRVGNGTPRPVTVDRRFLNEHPDVVVRYLAVLLRTAKWAERHPQEVLERLVPEGGGATTADVLASHGDQVHRSFTPKLTEDYVRGLETQKNFLRDHGFLKADFDIAGWIDYGPLAEAHRQVEQQPDPVTFETAEAA